MTAFLTEAQVNTIHGLYLSYFDRAADAGGADYWGSVYLAGLEAGKSDALIVAEIAGAFAQSDEFKTAYPSTQTAEQFVDTIYSNVLGREADDAGSAYWVAQLESGKVNKSDFIVAILNAVAKQGSGADYDYLSNRVEVSQYFAANVAESTSAEQIAALEGVTADDASVLAAINNINAVLGAFALTNGVDVATANVFNSVPVYTPGGNDLVNSLQDEDELTGSGDNPTLNVTLGSVNDAAESMITPILNGIETVNVQVTGQTVSGINFQDATGLETLNVTRVTANNSEISFEDLDATVQNIGVANATRDGELTFEYREDVLTAEDDELNLTLDNVRLFDLNIQEGGDTGEDQGYGFETVNVAVTGTTNIDYFDIDGNWEESADQTINFTVDAALEINDLDAYGAEYINIVANDTVMIADDEDDVLSPENDGISTDSLLAMVVTGDSLVEIDGLDGDDAGYTFDASGLQAAVHLGMEEAADGVVAISGIGDDWIYAYESMGADVTTNAGDDKVAIYDYYDSDGDQENTSQISTGEGNDWVYVAGDMLADTDEETESNELGDVERASIDTGAGDDEVDVGNLESAIDWDHNVLNDGNADDVYTMAAASITTGAGNDTVEALYLGENAVIDTGADDDEVTIDANTSDYFADKGESVLAADTADADEVTLAGDEDTLGAVIDLGAGDDVLTFNNHSGGDVDITLVGERAEVRGGDGDDVLNVNFVDSTNVVYAAGEDDADDFITGVETINLTALNAVDAQTAALTGEDINEAPNYADDIMPTVTLDVARVDTDLAVINLISEEDALLANPAEELFEPGVETGFDIDNLRADVALNLTAQEVGTSQGDSNDGATFLYPAIADDKDEEFDVELTVDYEDATAEDDTFTLNVTADSGEFDLDLYVEDDGDGISGSGSDADNEIENLVLDFADAGSHRIDLNGFGDAQHSEAQDDVFTSLVINSAAGAGEVFTVTDVTANDISIVVDADVRLALDAVLNDWNYDQTDLSMDYDMNTSDYYFNTYNIETGAGDDWVDMTTDMVDGDDTVDLGAGRNELVIANDVIIDDVLNSDEIFENIRGVQILTLAGDTWDRVTEVPTDLLGAHENAGTFGTNGEIDIAFMDDALATGIDTVQLVALEDESGTTNDAEVNLLIDTEFTRDLTINIDSRQTGAEFSVDNVAGVDLDINAAVADDVTTVIYFEDAGLPSATQATTAGNVDLVLELLDNGTYDIANGGTDVDLYVQDSNYAQINSITITSAAATAGTQLAFIALDDDWNADGTLTIDASDVNVVAAGAGREADGWWMNDLSGGIAVDGVVDGFEDDAVLDITGTDNDDWLWVWGTTDVGDTIDGAGGDDVIQAGIGNDILTGGTGSDAFVFETTGVVNGQDSILDFTTGVGNDILDFTNFFAADVTEGEYLEANGNEYANMFDMWAADGAVADADNDALYVATSAIGNINATDLIIGVDNGNATATTDDIAHLFQTTDQPGNNYLVLDDFGKAVVIFGDHNAAGTVQVFLVDSNLDLVETEVDSDDVFLVGTLNAADLDSFMAYNFGSNF